MTTIARRRAQSQRRRDPHPRRASLRAARPTVEPVSPVNPHGRGGIVVFEVAFTSAMTDVDLDVLRHQLDMTLHTAHKLPADPNSPGVARLDHYSGVFLEHAASADQWVLQARTWGEPSPRTTHEWHVCVAQVAHRLDPRVALPERASAAVPDVPQRPVGWAANRRLVPARRRLVGLA